MLVLNAADVAQALPMSAAIEGMRHAFAALADGRTVMPERLHLAIEPHDGVCLVMPAFVDDGQDQSLAVKVVSLFPGNPARGLAFIQGAVLALEPDTARPIALLEGATLTAIRTGAASGVATDLLAGPDARTAAIFGAGVQARAQLEAVATVRALDAVWVYDPDAERRAAFIHDMASQGRIPADTHPARSPQEAVGEADIICTATSSTTAVFDDAHLKPGVHINAIGSHQPHVREVPGQTVVRALVVVDSRRAALNGAGDLLQPIDRGLIGPDHIHAELGDLILGRAAGRSSPDQVTLFKSVGVAVQDAVAARLAFEHAQRLGLGQRVEW